MATDLIHIYVLTDERGEIRYVGMTRHPRERLRAHLADQTNTHRGKWIRSLLRRGARPAMRVIQTLPLRDRCEAERYWIAYFGGIGCSLVNGTLGGEGTFGLRRRWTDEQKAKASQSHKSSERARARLAQMHSDPEWRAKISAAAKGRRHRPQSAEARSAISASHKRNPRVREHLERLRNNPEIEARRIASSRAAADRRRGMPRPMESVRKHFKPITDQYGNRYESLTDASKRLGIPISSISTVASGKRPSTHGYRFVYEAK